VSPTAAVRLLTHEKRIAELVPSVALFSQQYKTTVEVRSSVKDLHDRYVFVDKRACYQSGASFKYGGIKPTILTQIVDAFPAIQKTYEDLWIAATKAM
jgi:hypothetical protein